MVIPYEIPSDYNHCWNIYAIALFYAIVTFRRTRTLDQIMMLLNNTFGQWKKPISQKDCI